MESSRNEPRARRQFGRGMWSLDSQNSRLDFVPRVAHAPLDAFGSGAQSKKSSHCHSEPLEKKEPVRFRLIAHESLTVSAGDSHQAQ